MEHMTLAVDKARRHEWNTLRKNGKLAEATDLKGQRFTLLKNNINLDELERSRIDSIMKSRKDLGTVYSLKESLRDTWDFESKYDTANHLISWLLAAKNTGLSALDEIVTLVDNHFYEILH